MGDTRVPSSPRRCASDELRPVVSLFADVVGSTGLGERLAPSEVKALIGECVSRICETVETYGGAVRSYMGDGIAGFFGIDYASENDAECAARAALEILRLVEIYAAEVEAAWGVSGFNVRVGINAGRVAVGNVGASAPQRIALGDSVNVAARLQSAARPGAIFIGEDAATALGRRFLLRSVGSLELKGRAAPVRAYELVSETSPTMSENRAAFVGRAEELDVIEDAFADLSKGRGQMLLIAGEGGIGKSRLLDEAQRRTSADVLWLRGRCDPMDWRLPFAPFVHALCGWLDVDRTTPAIETRVRLQARGRALFGDAFVEYAPHLSRFLGIELGTKADRALDGLPPEVLAKGLTDSYIGWLDALAARQSVVVAIDNFGSAGDSTVELALELLGRLESLPILFLVTTRADPHTPAKNLHARAILDLAHRAVELRLGALSEEDSYALLDLLSAQMHIDQRLASLIVMRAEGNPLYLEELYNAVVLGEHGTPAAANSLPEALERLLLSRIDRLSADAKTVLQCASILGRCFAYGVIAGMTDQATLDRGLKALLRADLIREKDRSPVQFEFKHGLVREAALSTLNPERYRELNAAAGEALRNWSEFELGRDAESVANYYLASGDMSRAVQVMELLSSRQARVFRWDEARALLSVCVEEYRRLGYRDGFVRVARKMADLLSLRGEWDSAVALVDEALTVSRERDLSRELMITKGRYLSEAGMDDAARLTLEQVERQYSERAADPALLILIGQVALHRNDLQTAGRCLRELGNLHTLANVVKFDAVSLAAGVAALTGDLDKAESWALQGQLLADHDGQLLQQLTARRHVALVYLLKGCIPESYELTKAVHQRCIELGWTTGEMEAAVGLLHIGGLCGFLDEVEGIGVNALKRSTSHLWTGLLAANFCEVLVARGDYDSAKGWAEVALALGDALPGWARLSARLSLIRLAECDGDTTSYVADMERLTTEIRDGDGAICSVALAEIAAFEAKAGNHEVAERYLAKAQSALPMLDRPTAAVVSRIVSATLQKGGSVAAIAALQRLVASVRDMKYPIEEGHLCIALADVDATKAEYYLAHAARIFRDCGAVGYLPLVERRQKVLSPR